MGCSAHRACWRGAWVFKAKRLLDVKSFRTVGLAALQT